MSCVTEREYYVLYKTTNVKNGMIYVGAHATDNINDSYIGSGAKLQEDINLFGRESFTKEILSFHNDIYDLALAESLYVDRDFVNRDDTYNIKVGGSIISALGVTDNHRLIYSKLAKQRYENLSQEDKEDVCNRLREIGKKSNWSDDKLDQWRSNLSKANKGNPKVIKANSERYNNLTDEQKVARAEKLSQSKRKLYENVSYDVKLKNAKNGLNKMREVVQCEHCGASMNIGNYKRWHGDNCKVLR